MSMVEFELRPLAEIEPWGRSPNRTLHWFGLSEGAYHIDLAGSKLLEYVSAEDSPRFVEYQLARIHEDLIAMLPDAVEAVPRDVALQFRDGSLSATLRHLRGISESRDDGDPGLDTCLDALGARALDTAYLNPSAGIWIWSTDGKTILEWDNRDRLYEGRAVWTAQAGRHELRCEEFTKEMQSFDRRLMEAMGARIQQAAAHWPRPDVHVDFTQLEAEQVERSTWLASALRHGRRATDWRTVLAVLSRTGK